MSEKYLAEKFRLFRVRVDHMVTQEREQTEQVRAALLDEGNWISSFAAEKFMELPTLRRYSRRLSRALALFDAGEIRTAPDAPAVTDPQEFMAGLEKEFRHELMTRVGVVSGSTSPAANQMEAYHIHWLAKIVAWLSEED